MTKLKQNGTSSIKTKINKTVSSPINNNKEVLLSDIEISILRGELLRYSLYIDAVKNNIKELKKSNPKYLKLINDIIELSITENSTINIELPLETLLKKLPLISFNNQEILDFTNEVLFYADNLTAKFYLSVISNEIIDNLKLKQHFKATIPFVKHIFASLQKYTEIEKAEQFINILTIIINPKVDYKKIELLPKIKYIADSISKKEYNLDITQILHSKISTENLKENIDNLLKNAKLAEKYNLDFDCTNYLIKN